MQIIFILFFIFSNQIISEKRGILNNQIDARDVMYRLVGQCAKLIKNSQPEFPYDDNRIKQPRDFCGKLTSKEFTNDPQCILTATKDHLMGLGNTDERVANFLSSLTERQWFETESSHINRIIRNVFEYEAREKSITTPSEAIHFLLNLNINYQHRDQYRNQPFESVYLQNVAVNLQIQESIENNRKAIFRGILIEYFKWMEIQNAIRKDETSLPMQCAKIICTTLLVLSIIIGCLYFAMHMFFIEMNVTTQDIENVIQFIKRLLGQENNIMTIFRNAANIINSLNEIGAGVKTIAAEIVK